MKEDVGSVAHWYSTEKNYEYMTEAAKNGLKTWEREVTEYYFPRDSHILDIGCGTGREAFALYDMGFRVTAVDISMPILEKAKSLAAEAKKNIDFSLINGLDLPFQENSFDIAVIWSQTLGMLYGRDNQLHILNQCSRVLKADGILSFSAHEKEFVEKNYPQYVEGKKFWAYKDCYWEVFSTSELTELAEEAGFEVLCCQKGQVYRPEDGTIIHCLAKK